MICVVGARFLLFLGSISLARAVNSPHRIHREPFAMVPAVSVERERRRWACSLGDACRQRKCSSADSSREAAFLASEVPGRAAAFLVSEWFQLSLTLAVADCRCSNLRRADAPSSNSSQGHGPSGITPSRLAFPCIRASAYGFQATFHHVLGSSAAKRPWPGFWGSRFHSARSISHLGPRCPPSNRTLPISCGRGEVTGPSMR
jgi:hypothetical protein